jgi:hypothetical protein
MFPLHENTKLGCNDASFPADAELWGRRKAKINCHIFIPSFHLPVIVQTNSKVKLERSSPIAPLIWVCVTRNIKLITEVSFGTIHI